MNYDVVIIGAGFSGLSAGAILANKGLKIAVIEQENELGGRAKVIEKDGFILDYGPHSYRYGEESGMVKVLRELGEAVELVPNIYRNYIVQGKEFFLLPWGKGEKLESAKMFFSKDEVKKFEVPLLRLYQSEPEQYYEQSVSQFFKDELEKEPRFREALRILGMALMEPEPEKLSAGELILHLKRVAKTQIQSAEIKGTTKVLLDKLVNKLKEKGAEIHLGTKLWTAKMEKNKIKYIITSKGDFYADAVIYSPPVYTLFSVIDKKNFPSHWVKRVLKLEPVSGLVVEYGLKEKISGINGWLIDLDNKVLGKFPSNLEPEIAPDQKQLSSWIMLMDTNKISVPEEIRTKLHFLRNLIKKLFPDFFLKTLWERILVLPVIDGIRMTKEQSLPKRVDIKAPSIDNLFLIGDTVRAEGVSGDIAFNSALKVVPFVLEFLSG